MSGSRILIIGALSAIAEQTARLYAAEGASLCLVARRADGLEAVARDLALRGAASVSTVETDLAQADEADIQVKAWADAISGLDAAFIFYGALGEQRRAESDLAHARSILDINFTSQALWALALADRFEKEGKGALVMVSSVAGDRGRMSNYVYGAAKGGMSLLGQGLAHRLAKTGARAIVVKLGFVATPMTAGMKRSGPLWTSAENAAVLVKKAANARGPIVYAPWFWRFIMLIIRAVPAPIFHRTKL